MIEVEKVDTWGFEAAIRGMRNPLNSWDKSDSDYGTDCENCSNFEGINEKGWSVCKNPIDYPCPFVIGDADLTLMQKLFEGGTEHRKYLRQIFVSMDIVAPLYWWKEFDTYKVGTVANSCSTMHKIHSKKFTLDDFSHEHLMGNQLEVLMLLVEELNYNREHFLETSHKNWWWQLIQLLPSSYNQKRTITMNYENVVSMIKQRENHKLDEWRIFVDLLKNKLPYIKAIMGLK